jgi:hypothetical protein
VRTRSEWTVRRESKRGKGRKLEEGKKRKIKKGKEKGIHVLTPFMFFFYLLWFCRLEINGFADVGTMKIEDQWFH